MLTIILKYVIELICARGQCQFVGRRAVWNAAIIILLDAKTILYIENVNIFMQFIRKELC